MSNDNKPLNVDTSAVIVVGLPYNEMIGKAWNEPSPIRFIEPTENADLSDCLIGIVLTSTTGLGYKEVAMSIETKASRKLFKELTGREARVYLTVVQDY
jgi:hypothetical protein